MRIPYYAAEDSALATPIVGAFLRRLGAIPALASGIQNVCLPSSSLWYLPGGRGGQLQAVLGSLPHARVEPWVCEARSHPPGAIVPVAVFGGEESLPVAWTVKALEPLIGSILGLPLVPVPLPARWKIVFHAPVDACQRDGYGSEATRRYRHSHRLQRTVQNSWTGRPTATPWRACRRSWRRRRTRLGACPNGSLTRTVRNPIRLWLFHDSRRGGSLNIVDG